MLKILFFGDIVGKIGRRAVKESIAKLKKKYQPDFIIANAENLAHGNGVTEKTLKEMMELGIDFFTSGNHIWNNQEINKIFAEKKIPIIRPANYPEGTNGEGYMIVKKGHNKILMINLLGRVFFRENFECPFRTLEKILEKTKKEKVNAIIVDFHAEATSEKNTLARYFDGQVSAVFGTHTHIQTADEQLLKNGTAYITDVGMNGSKDSSLGVDLKGVTKMFLTQIPQQFEIPEHGICQINAIFAIIKGKNSAEKIERINLQINI